MTKRAKKPLNLTPELLLLLDNQIKDGPKFELLLHGLIIEVKKLNTLIERHPARRMYRKALKGDKEAIDLIESVYSIRLPSNEVTHDQD